MAIQKKEITLTRATNDTGFTSTVDTGITGAIKILWLVVREDATADRGANLAIYFQPTTAAITAVADETKAFKLLITGAAGHATTAAHDATANSRPIVPDTTLTSNTRQTLRVAANIATVSGGGSATTLYITMYYDDDNTT